MKAIQHQIMDILWKMITIIHHLTTIHNHQLMEEAIMAHIQTLIMVDIIHIVMVMVINLIHLRPQLFSTTTI